MGLKHETLHGPWYLQSHDSGSCTFRIGDPQNGLRVEGLECRVPRVWFILEFRVDVFRASILGGPFDLESLLSIP